jgi:hypothetical protein
MRLPVESLNIEFSMLNEFILNALWVLVAAMFVLTLSMLLSS